MNIEQLQKIVELMQEAYEQMPKAIEHAYREGHRDAMCGGVLADADDDWNQSNSKKALDAGIGDGVKV